MADDVVLVQVAPEGDAQVWVNPSRVAAVADTTADGAECEVFLVGIHHNVVMVAASAGSVVERLGDAFAVRTGTRVDQ